MEWELKIKHFSEFFIEDDNKQDIHLMPKEYAFLKLLTENASYIVTREEFCKYTNIGSIRSVDVHKRRIKEKCPNIPIETVWKIGYRWNNQK